MGVGGCGGPGKPFMAISLLQPALRPHPALHKIRLHTGYFPWGLDPADQFRRLLFLQWAHILSPGSLCLLGAPQRLGLRENITGPRAFPLLTPNVLSERAPEGPKELVPFGLCCLLP